MSQPIRSEVAPPVVAEQSVVQSEEVFSSSAPQADSIAPAQQNSSCFQMLLHAVSAVWICTKEKICYCFFPLGTAQVWQRSLAGLGREQENWTREQSMSSPSSIPQHTSPYLGMTSQQAGMTDTLSTEASFPLESRLAGSTLCFRPVLESRLAGNTPCTRPVVAGIRGSRGNRRVEESDNEEA